jgi:hypothetical protein
MASPLRTAVEVAVPIAPFAVAASQRLPSPAGKGALQVLQERRSATVKYAPFDSAQHVLPSTGRLRSESSGGSTDMLLVCRPRAVRRCRLEMSAGTEGIAMLREFCGQIPSV